MSTATEPPETQTQDPSGYVLRTERLGFRRWTKDDLPLALELWCDPEVMRHLGGAWTPAMAEARLSEEIEREARHDIQYWPAFLLATGEHVGCAGLKLWKSRLDALEVGVHIHRAFWSGRFGEEAARAMLSRGFSRPEVTELMAGHGPENVNSQALILRLGFAYSHDEIWGPQQRLHPFYRLPRPASELHS